MLPIEGVSVMDTDMEKQLLTFSSGYYLRNSVLHQQAHQLQVMTLFLLPSAHSHTSDIRIHSKEIVLLKSLIETLRIR